MGGRDQRPESVAEHCFRCAVMAYYIAHLEKANVSKVMIMALFNDVHEARINDLHKMGHFYIDFKEAEKMVFKDQIKDLDPSVKGELEVLRKEYEAQRTKGEPGRQRRRYPRVFAPGQGILRPRLS